MSTSGYPTDGDLDPYSGSAAYPQWEGPYPEPQYRMPVAYPFPHHNPGWYPSASPGPVSALRTATIALFWSVTASVGLVTVAVFTRKSTWDSFAAGNSSLRELNATDNFVALAGLLQVSLELAAAILVCLWSNRIAHHAVARGTRDVRPGLAGGGWFIPIGWFFIPFDQLRRSSRGIGSPYLSYWQLMFAASLVIGIVSRFAVGDLDSGNVDYSDVSGRLSTQSVFAALTLLGFATASALATRATADINRTVTPVGRPFR